MAACGGLQHIFEKPLPESAISLPPWKDMKSVDHHSFTEIFGQLHLKEGHVLDPPESSISSSSPFPPSSPSSSFSSNSTFSYDTDPPLFVVDHCKSNENGSRDKKQHKRRDSISSTNSESSSICTEENGSESSDDVEDLMKTESCVNNWQPYWSEELRRRSRKRNIGEFPPPISCIGKSGKPWVCFKSFREDGRFILKEIRIPTQELLHACRENGRLKMQFIQSDDEVFDDDEEGNVEENNEDTGENEDGDMQIAEA